MNNMDIASQHWPILRKLDANLSNKVRSFMVMGDNGDGVIVATEDGQGYWLGKLRFDSSETRTSSTKPIPLDVPELVQMARGHFHILLLNKRGEIYSMGQNDYGQLGTGVGKTYFSPQLICCPHRFISVRCGSLYSLALTDDGKVWEWGSGDYFLDHDDDDEEEEFNPEFCPFPRQMSKLDDHRIVSIECSVRQSLALTDRGEVFIWGSNDWGQHWPYLHTPIQIVTPSPVKSIAAGPYHSLVLTQTGEVYSCGNNDCGQLGVQFAIKSSDTVVKVKGLPPISQISSHFEASLSIAMSPDKRCFVWGDLTPICISNTPMELPPFYSTVESPLSFFCSQRYTSYSVSIQETLPNRVIARMSRMFDNPETNSDVQFVVEQRTIHSHRCILSSSSDYFSRMFSERWLAPEDPIVRVTIPNYSYEVFHAFLRFLYTDCLEVLPELLPEMFELASQYLDSDLQKLCLSRMSTTITSATCCLYYPLTQRHSLLPELEDFQQELVQFASTRMSEIATTAAYKSMEPDLCDKLTVAAQNFSTTLNLNSLPKLLQ